MKELRARLEMVIIDAQVTTPLVNNILYRFKTINTIHVTILFITLAIIQNKHGKL